MTELTGRTALITGAGSGLGRAAALRLAREGAVIGALDIDAGHLAQLCGEIEAAGGRALALPADVADFAAMRAAVQKLTDATGRLDIIFANAGINGVWAPIDDLQPDEWHKTIAVNLTGIYHALHLGVPHLKAAGGGSIVITSSINGTRTFTTPGASAYSVTKGAGLILAQQLSVELGRHKIRVNAICPGKIATSIGERTFKRNTEKAQVPVIYPEGDIPLTGTEAGTAEEVAELVLFLASDRARHITGTPVWIDGAQSMMR
jgi:NAD(P)-dependent dehydrogenase (short-subunit alcohol dehydrogenase family)